MLPRASLERAGLWKILRVTFKTVIETLRTFTTATAVKKMELAIYVDGPRRLGLQRMAESL